MSSVVTSRKAKEARTAWLFVAPAALHLLIFAAVPIAYALWLSLTDWRILKNQMDFVGLQNYAATLTDGPFWNAMWNSARYTLVGVPVGMAVALGVALLVAMPIRGTSVFRTIFYIPAVSSGVAVSMLWIYVYLPETGLINATAAALGMDSVDFLNTPATAMWALVFMSIWTGLGPKMIIFLAGLIGIPPSLYEAAELDGATGWRAFRHVTWPMLAPTSLFVLVTSTIGSFQVFTPIYMMTRGGPLDSTDVVGYHIYTEAWRRFQIGSASAQSFVLLVVIAGVAYIQYRLMKGRLEGYSAA